MLFRETVTFRGPSVYNEQTGNWELGEPYQVDNLDVRVYGTVDANGKDNMINAKQIISVRAREPFELNHIMEWNGKRWKVQVSNFTSYSDKIRRHWFSARYIEAGDIK